MIRVLTSQVATRAPRVFCVYVVQALQAGHSDPDIYLAYPVFIALAVDATNPEFVGAETVS